MKSALVCAALASVLLAPCAASAATSPYAAPAASSGVQNWGGLYGGLHVGVLWGDFSGASATAFGPSNTDTALFGGVQGGYNWQFDRWVVGGELDFSLTPVAEGGTGNSRLEENWGSTLRARGGYMFGKWLPFGTLGLGLTNADSKLPAGSVNNTHVGLALGAGFDYAISDNLSWRTEYLHVDVPQESDTIGGANFNGGAGNNEIRIGANYHFH